MNLELRQRFVTASHNLELFPLQTSAELQQFGVEYDRDTLIALQQRIEDSPLHSKIILTGHTGCGKSTLLAKLAHGYKDWYKVALFSIADIENSDIDHIIILFATGVELLQLAEREKIPLPINLKASFIDWFDKKTRTAAAGVQTEASLGANILDLIGVKIKADATVRTEIKKEFKPKISELVGKLNEIAAAIVATINKPLLVIIDDIDKLDRATVYEVFRDNIKTLFLPNFCTIYTLPIWAVRDGELLPILENETSDRIELMRVMKLYAKGETHKQPPEVPVPQVQTLDLLKRILLLRLDPQVLEGDRESELHESKLIETDALQRLILYSGGVLRELMRLANECCRLCLIQIRREPEQAVKITGSIVEEAINNLRIQMARPLGKKSFEILQQVRQHYKPDDPQDPEFFLLLKGLSIIEYRNAREWHDVHPIAIALLEEWSNNGEVP